MPFWFRQNSPAGWHGRVCPKVRGDSNQIVFIGLRSSKYYYNRPGGGVGIWSLFYKWILLEGIPKYCCVSWRSSSFRVLQFLCKIRAIMSRLFTRRPRRVWPLISQLAAVSLYLAWKARKHSVKHLVMISDIGLWLMLRLSPVDAFCLLIGYFQIYIYDDNIDCGFVCC